MKYTRYYSNYKTKQSIEPDSPILSSKEDIITLMETVLLGQKNFIVIGGALQFSTGEDGLIWSEILTSDQTGSYVASMSLSDAINTIRTLTGSIKVEDFPQFNFEPYSYPSLKKQAIQETPKSTLQNFSIAYLKWFGIAQLLTLNIIMGFFWLKWSKDLKEENLSFRKTLYTLHFIIITACLALLYSHFIEPGPKTVKTPIGYKTFNKTTYELILFSHIVLYILPIITVRKLYQNIISYCENVRTKL